MKYVIDSGGLYDLAKVFSVNKHTGEITVVIATQERVHLTFDYDTYISTTPIKKIYCLLISHAQVLYVDLFEKDWQDIVMLFDLAQHAQLDYQFFSTGDNVKKDIQLTCRGVGSYASISGVYVVGDEQNSFITTKQHHVVERAASDVVVNGIALGCSRAGYEGDICIEEHAFGSNVHQKNKNMSIGNNAQIYAKPMLRVYNKDVSCSHASATGQLSQEMLMFARSRGLSDAQARKMILQGFLCGTVTDKLVQEKIIKKLQTV